MMVANIWTFRVCCARRANCYRWNKEFTERLEVEQLSSHVILQALDLQCFLQCITHNRVSQTNILEEGNHWRQRWGSLEEDIGGEQGVVQACKKVTGIFLEDTVSSHFVRMPPSKCCHDSILDDLTAFCQIVSCLVTEMLMCYSKWINWCNRLFSKIENLKWMAMV